MHASKFSGGLAVLSLNGDVNAIWVGLAKGTGFAGAKKQSILLFRGRRGDLGMTKFEFFRSPCRRCHFFYITMEA